MASKSTKSFPSRKHVVLQLACSSTPTWQTPVENLGTSLSSSGLNGCRTNYQRKTYQLSRDCGPYTNLGHQIQMRSQRHQSHLKSASIKLAIRLVYKYNARCVSELYDKCSADEWASLLYISGMNYTRDLQYALDIYIKDNLEFQRMDRWEWLISFQVYLPTEEQEIISLLQAQGIDVDYFFECLRIVLLCKDHKINTIRLWGTPDSGKSLIARLIVRYFICPSTNNHGSDSPFFFSNFLNKSIALCDELFVTPATCDDYKSILGGGDIDVNKKNIQEKQNMSRTPIILTSNYAKFGRGHLNAIDEEALQTRCFSFYFPVIYKPKVTVTPPAFAHLAHNIYNKDMFV